MQLTKIILFILISFLVGCLSKPTINKSVYEPLRQGNPLSNDALNKIYNKSAKDKYFAQLLQAFALLRTKDLNDSKIRKDIESLLTEVVASFDTMQDPENFSKAFSADESKTFIGLPHERMFASITAAVMHMADKRYDMALPYLRNAEFLDARFQKMPFGTDAPLIYALMQYCLIAQKADNQSIQRAKDGLYRSVRFLELSETINNLIKDMHSADIRTYSVKNNVAYMLLEISLYYSLLSSPNNASLGDLLLNLGKDSDIFIPSLKTHFSEEYKEKTKKTIDILANMQKGNHKTNVENWHNQILTTVSLEVRDLAEKMLNIYKNLPDYNKNLNSAYDKAQKRYDDIQQALNKPKLILTFKGQGPRVERKGEYNEITVIKTSDDGSTQSSMRLFKVNTNTNCGFNRGENGSFSLVLCQNNIHEENKNEKVSLTSLEILGLSRKAHMIAGRKFDEILKKRAMFKSAAINTASVSAWSSFFLFYLGTDILSKCSGDSSQEACYALGLSVWAAAGVTGVFSLSAWLIGRSINASADSRYNHLSYESVLLAIEGI